jgi:hypothetical protein
MITTFKFLENSDRRVPAAIRGRVPALVRLPTVRSTTDLDTAEFVEYIEQCRRLGAEMGVIIPSPGFAE